MRSQPIIHAAMALLLSACAATAQAVDTPIYTIQGSGATSAYVGQTLTTTGVVTRVNNNGFFMQDLVGDADPSTSDGIFVFTSTAPTVLAGQYIRVSGKVAEFNVGAATNANTLAHTVTELTAPITIVDTLGSGYTIAPTPVTLPEMVNDEIERYEGMLISIAGPLTVSQNYFVTRYGQLSISFGGRLETPTNRVRPGAPAIAMANDNARRRFILDDGSSLQNPNPTPYFAADMTIRAGDTTPQLIGVLDYGLTTASNTDNGDYRLHPTVAPVFTRANPRTTAPESVGGNVKVASFNVLNFFTTFTNGNTADGQTGQGCSLGTSVNKSNCRGADSLAEFTRQRAKIVEAISAVSADAVGLMEIQNNGNITVQNLVDALNAKMGAGTYAAVPIPTSNGVAGTGTDAIRVAMLYKPARLATSGASASDTSAINNRPPLAQTFVAPNGELFTLIVNHLKSKSGCPAATDADAAGNTDSGDGQGCWNSQRVQQAQALRSFVARLQTASGSNDVLMIGDFNAYAQEDPIYDMTSSGFIDQVGRYNSFGYSFVFDGTAGRLDQAITSASLSPKVTRAIEWHINADEPSGIDYNLEFKQPACATCAPDPYTVSPYRASDHDPVVVGLSIFKTLAGTAARDTLVGTPGDDIFIGGAGADTMTGNGGSNVYVYNNLRDAGDTITDFTPARDFLDLRSLLQSLGYAGSAPVADGWIKLVDGRTGLSVQVVSAAGSSAFRVLATLPGVTAAAVVPSRDFIVN